MPQQKTQEILQAIKSYMIMENITFDALANMAHKDVTVVAKHMSLKANPTITSILEITNALGIELVVQTPNSVRAEREADVSAYRNTIAELGAELERLRRENERLTELVADKQARIDRRETIIADYRAQIIRKDAIIDSKDVDIRRKDATLAKFVDRLDDLYKELLHRKE